LIGEWNLPDVSLGIKILILNSIGGKIILDFHWFMKDEETIDWREGFLNFHWTRRTSSRRGHGSLRKGEGNILRFEKEKEENECVRKKLILMCGKVLFMGKMCANKSMERSCV
jgi:hypothetical protein